MMEPMELTSISAWRAGTESKEGKASQLLSLVTKRV
jgi:hypothetical protein